MECVSPSWAKAYRFPGHGDDISKEGPGKGGEKDAPSNERKMFPMTLNLVNNRFFVINNGGPLEGASAASGKSCIVRVAH